MLNSKLRPHSPRRPFLPGITLTLLAVAGLATAQDVVRSKKTQEPAAVTIGQTRPRQVTAAASDPVSKLREDVAAAATPEERARLQFRLVDQLAAANRKPEAVAELHALASEDRFDPSGFFNIGNALARLDDADGAIEAYRKAIEQRPGGYSRALNNLGVVLLQQAHWDEAYEALLSALKIEKFRYAEASYNLGRLYSARGENDLAIREWRRAIAVNPQHAGAAAALANHGSRASGPAPRSTPNTATRQPGASSPSAPAGRTAQVDRATYDLMQRARDEHERGLNEDAVRDYRSVLARQSGYFALANLELGFVLANLKRGDEAIAALLPVSTNDGARFPIAYYHLARLYEARGELQAAAENYRRAVTAYPDDNAQFLLDLSRVREKLGDLSGALAALEQYVRVSERAGRKPEWTAARLTELRQRIAASSLNSRP